MRFTFFLVALAFATQSAAQAPEDNCRPLAESAQPQYIVGYGSLMQDESRKRTSPAAGPAHPIELKGYRRGWYARPAIAGFGTTYLGVVPDAAGRLNAVLYEVDPAELKATDRRERSYCRILVPFASIKALEPQAATPSSGQAWIYAARVEDARTPTREYPIVQSYVDIFVSGCLEQEERFGLAGFARDCLATTAGWSYDWVNDRLYPRRPFIYQPRAFEIDRLLSASLKPYFERIRLEP